MRVFTEGIYGHWRTAGRALRSVRRGGQRVNEAWAVVQRKFGAIAAGTSQENPTEAELDRLEKAKQRRDDVDRRMRQFMKERFGVDE